MSLICGVENRLGSIDTWPTHITEHLFCDAPALSTLEELIAFFFGSGIPCPMACQLYHACNGRVQYMCPNISILRIHSGIHARMRFT